MQYREEHDTMGTVKVPADRYWGAQTQRSYENFPVGPRGSMPKEIIHAFGYLTKASSTINSRSSCGRRVPVRSRT